MDDQLDTLRREYGRDRLEHADLDPDPFGQFSAWLAAAERIASLDANACALSTVGMDGMPSSRIVLLKHVDRRGFVFYGNRNSRKGRDLAARPVAALLFYWPQLERQVRISGNVVRTNALEDDQYWRTRPRMSQIAGWASPQSRTLADRTALDQAVEDTQARFANVAQIARPPFWGGWRLQPTLFEFWQGRPGRLHDRFHYRPQRRGAWTITRVAP